jgi:hypothetical protein
MGMPNNILKLMLKPNCRYNTAAAPRTRQGHNLLHVRHQLLLQLKVQHLHQHTR